MADPAQGDEQPLSRPRAAAAGGGDYRTGHVGDWSDTSPYPTDRPVIGVPTATYIANMALLIRALER